MKNLFYTLNAVLFIVAAFNTPASAQQQPKADDPLMKIYRASAPKINQLVHTKLDVRFDYKKRYMYGKEWVTLKPYMYPTDTLRLDAKGMDIKTIAVVKNGKNVPLKYHYDDSLSLAIHLDKVYHNNESYTIYIDYTSKPNNLKVKGSAAINDAKGLYFINPDGTEKDKPIEIWTQGETESSSAWFPTIDKPNQKCTDEISMTVQSKYVTLSNGKLVSQKPNADGTRTDTWKMDQPHSVYLFMMAVGDFKIYHDTWRGKPVDYYLEPKYAPYAKQIFGNTPEMIEFYSKTLGVDYPWNKYAQIVVRDYVSGAMENTTATLHGEQVQKTARELIDSYDDESQIDIAHELFHQWFGDYVTAESWSNITMNESFADFSEMLWAEHKFGKDEADAHSYSAMQSYLRGPANRTKNLVRFYYDDKEDVFDLVSYQKGGRILNMLKNYLGDEAFFKGLKIYLTKHAYSNGEAQQLRLALEESSGLDLNWYFNQWYYGAGNPSLKIGYKWDDASKTQTVYLEQTQAGQIFKLPFAVDIYAGGKKERHKVWMNDKMDTLTFHSDVKPDLVNVDGDKVILTDKKDAKTLNELVFQYFNAPLYLDRFEAITAAGVTQSDKGAQKVLIAALNDKYYGLRIKAIQALDMTNNDVHTAALPVLVSLVQTDKNTLVQAAAIAVLAKLKSPTDLPLFKQALTSQSYAVDGAALNAIAAIDPTAALPLTKQFEKENSPAITIAIMKIFAASGTDAQWPTAYNLFINAQGQGRFGSARDFSAFIGKQQSPANAQQGIAALRDLGIKFKSQNGVGQFITTMLQNIKAARAKLNDTASAQAADDALKAFNDAK